MDFYISWSHSDALYADYFTACPTLVSATPDNGRPFRHYKRPPRQVIIDSGALYYEKQQKGHTVYDIFQRQVDILQDLPSTTSVQLVQVDKTLLHKSKLSDQFAAMEQNLFHAYEYMKLFTASKLPTHIQPMGVIQGYDLPSLSYSWHELRKMGFRRFGIGSLLTRHPREQMAMIQHTKRFVGTDPLHIFGVTGLPQMREMVKINVTSIDSSRPTMAAAYYQVFYSQPFRTYVLNQSRVTKQKKQRIDTPLPCDCPVCQISPSDILIPSPRHYMKLRSIHNYYHLIKTIDQMKPNTEVPPHAVPDVLRF